MTSTTSKAAPLVPLSKRPEYLAVVAEHNELAAAAAKVETRIREIELMLSSNVDSPVDKDAARVENALHYAATGEVKGLSNDPTMLRDEHVLLREQRDAIKKAMIAKHDTIFSLERRLSYEVSAEAHDAHSEIRKRFSACIAEISALYEQENALRMSIHRNGYEAFFKHPLPPHLVVRQG